ncbi:MAG: peptidoglycan DD-metalloendopeptidase family protein [Proteobacteria bacterium]|nr:peptidoglycan DD-metalloendopeptidase family protein [Pseudomonadota bacterium]
MSPHSLQAENNPEKLKLSLKEVKEKLVEQERSLKSLRTTENDLKKSIEKINLDVTGMLSKKIELVETVKQIKQESDQINSKIKELDTNLKSQNEILKKRLNALYRISKQAIGSDYLFNSKSTTDLLKRIRYLSVVLNYDKHLIKEMVTQYELYQTSKLRFDKIEEEKVFTLSEIEKLEKELLARKDEKAKLLEESQTKIKEQEVEIVSLKESAKKLEKVVSKLMGGEEEEANLSEGDFKTSGLAALKGKLAFPVVGEILQKFGRQKHEEYSEMIFVKGLEVSAGVGSRVKAIADGKVALNQILPVYGNVLIVDHGGRFYSLYGRVASTLKSVGDEVKAREDLAILGEQDYKGRNFYFELRVKGKAIDPLQYFKDLKSRD